MTKQGVGPKVAINVTEILQSSRRFMLGDFDDFSETSATADTERWTSDYYTGTEGGAADINTTTANKLYMIEDPDATPTAAGYGVTYTEPLESRFYQTIVDLSTTFGAQTSGNTEAGIMITKSSAYDSQNYLNISRYNTSSVHRISVQGKLNNVAVTTVNATVTDNAVALRVDRTGDGWKFYYSLSQSPTEEWVFIAEVDDASDYMTDRTTPMLYVYTSGGNTDNSVIGNFDNWKLYISAMGLDEAIGNIGRNTADNLVSTSNVVADENGSILERLEQVQKAVNNGSGYAIPTNTSVVDLLGDFTGPHDGTVYDDNVFAHLKKLSTYVADGDGDYATGTKLAANKSLADAVGQTGAISTQTGDIDATNVQNRLDANNLATGIVAASAADGFEEDGTGGRLYDVFNSTDANLNVFTMDGGTDYNDNLFSFLKKLSQYTADGDGDFATGTVNPANKSLYDLLFIDKSVEAGNTTGFTCTAAMALAETDVATLTNGAAITGTTRRKITYHLDMTNIDADVGGGNCTIRVKEAIDESNYRTIDTITWVNGVSDNGVVLELPVFNHNLQVTFQMSVALAGDVAVPYKIITEKLEY